jgi:hypothetical protein
MKMGFLYIILSVTIDNEEEYLINNGEMGNKIYDAPFQGRICNDDAFKVLQILRLWTLKNTAQT